MASSTPFSFPRPNAVPRLTGRNRRVLLILVVLALLALAVTAYVTLETDYLWFQSVGFGGVFSRRLMTQLVLFFLFGVPFALVVGANVVTAYRLRPEHRPASQEQQQLEALRAALHPARTWILAAVLVVLTLITGSAAAGRWKTWLQWRNGTSFGSKDPQFHRDISYYAFTLPMQRFLLSMLFAVVVVSLLAVLATAYLSGGLRPQTAGPKVTPATRAHLSVLLGVFVLLKAWAYWLDRYGLNFSRRGFVDTGASYTDVHAVIPAKTILVVLAVICAGIFFANVRIRNWRLPAIAFGVMALGAIVIGGIYPLLVQQFSVRPSEADKEAPYISRNIEQTRLAYGLVPGESVKSTTYTGVQPGDTKSLRGDQLTLPNLRLLDPTEMPDTFQQLQGFKSFYTFPSTLDVDRYGVGDKQQEQVVAVRDINLDGLAAGQQSWINQHLVYTHGYGIVAAASNTVQSDGTPVFDESDIPPTGSLASGFQPRIYFGETSPTFSIVGAPKGGKDRELDFPDNSGIGQQNNTYTGHGGVSIGSGWRRLLYALRFKDKNLLFSSGVNGSSRILYVRNPRDRVAKVAPFLTLDSDPYPAIVGDHILWIVDGYTTTDGFPYAARTSLSSATNDTLSQTRGGRPAGEVNYIRNSVKATVDAYDGTVRLYQWGPRDAVLETWKKAFPGIVQPQSAIPADLLAHVRYPEDLFKVQRTLLTKYHITDAHSFYAGTDYWLVPDDPAREQQKPAVKVPQPPYYLTLALPGQTSASFQLTTSLLQNRRPNLAAFVSVQSDPTSPEYGTMSVLQLPSNAQVNGPGQVANEFESFTPASTELSLLRNGGSKVDLGNLLTLPLGNSFLYVEPIYVKSAGQTSFPTLKRVLVSFNGTVAYQPTLQLALDAVFGGTAPSPPTPGPSNGGDHGVSPSVAALITQLTEAQAAAEKALRAGDLTAYAAAEKRVATLIAQLAAEAKKPASRSG
ncbi:MAG: uncharacterized protein QOG34_726 [Frankiaceae bacterium]|nr:uncharacterized protein [Frankiaceae bacterium]